MSCRRIPAVYMRGGTSKGVFFHARDLPPYAGERDALLLRLLGSPDPHGGQADGMGAGSAATSKVALVSPSRRDDCDVDYLLGAVCIDRPLIDWSGNCDDLSAAVGPFAIGEGLVPAAEGFTRVRIWQAGLGRRIDAFVPVRNGAVVETGGFVEDGLPFPSAEIRLEYLEPAGGEPGTCSALLPTGNPKDELEVPGLGRVAATMITAGGPTVFLRAAALGLTGREPLAELGRKRGLLERLEAVRAAAAVRMGLAAGMLDASGGPASALEVCWVARPAAYRTGDGAEVPAERIDLLARLLSAGRLHPGCSGATSIALAAAAALPGTLVAEVARTLPGVPTRIGHAGGTLAVGADVSWRDGRWQVERAVLSRSARRLMSGWVHVPPAGESAGA